MKKIFFSTILVGLSVLFGFNCWISLQASIQNQLSGHSLEFMLASGFWGMLSVITVFLSIWAVENLDLPSNPWWQDPAEAPLPKKPEESLKVRKARLFDRIDARIKEEDARQPII